MPGRQSRVAEAMSAGAVLMLNDIPLREARRISGQYDYNGFPVVTREGRLVGMLTKGDLVRAVQASFANPDVWREPVARWMAHGVLALRPTDSLENAVALMVESGLRSLPVIDGNARVVGVLSRGDLLRALHEEDGP
jgi:CBS domain-containing protein